MRVGIRVNPDVTADTHPYIATGQGGIKFGVPVDQVVPLALAIRQHALLTLDTVAMHIGSQLLDAAPYAEGVRRLLDLVAQIRDAGVDTLPRSTSEAASASATATSGRSVRRRWPPRWCPWCGTAGCRW